MLEPINNNISFTGAGTNADGIVGSFDLSQETKKDIELYPNFKGVLGKRDNNDTASFFVTLKNLHFKSGISIPRIIYTYRLYNYTTSNWDSWSAETVLNKTITSVESTQFDITTIPTYQHDYYDSAAGSRIQVKFRLTNLLEQDIKIERISLEALNVDVHTTNGIADYIKFKIDDSTFQLLTSWNTQYNYLGHYVKIFTTNLVEYNFPITGLYDDGEFYWLCTSVNDDAAGIISAAELTNNMNFNNLPTLTLGTIDNNTKLWIAGIQLNLNLFFASHTFSLVNDYIEYSPTNYTINTFMARVYIVDDNNNFLSGPDHSLINNTSLIAQSNTILTRLDTIFYVFIPYPLPPFTTPVRNSAGVIMNRFDQFFSDGLKSGKPLYLKTYYYIPSPSYLNDEPLP